MKFSAILGSLAIYGIQVHAIPTDSDFQAIQPIEASSPIPNTLEARDNSCCVVLKNPANKLSKTIAAGTGVIRWYVLGNTDGCVVLVDRNGNSCSGWTLLPVNCDNFAKPLTIGIGSASDCSGH
ncbi:hypothetical protein E4U15_006347 [Claviceps sp. LM218 group G6]|nr:hypothetical protein E4U15_006347 [Claviceps sp. LM218 group G6]